MADEQKKTGLVGKLKDKLHIGHRSQKSGDDASSTSSQGPLQAGSEHGTPHSSQRGQTGETVPHTAAAAPATTSSAATSTPHQQQQGTSSGPVATSASHQRTSGSEVTPHGNASNAPSSHGLTKENYSGKHVEGDTVEKGAKGALTANNPEFQRAAELTQKAMQESAQADAFTKEAYEKATMANRYRQEAEGAEESLHAAERQLRQHQMLANEAKGKDKLAQQAAENLKTQELAAQDAVRRAEAAAAQARKRYEEAKKMADEAEMKRANAQRLADDAVARRNALEGLDQKAALLAEEARREGELAQAQKANVGSINAQLNEAQALAEAKRRELAEAEALMANRAEALQAGQRAAQQHDHSSKAKMEEARGHALNAQQAREDLASIERRLAAAEDEARAAKAATLEYADIAKVERERALAARAEAEQAGRVLQAARAELEAKRREMQAANATIEEQERAMGPLRSKIADLEGQCNRQYATAEETAREWSEITSKADMHKGKWHEYWTEAKAIGDQGDAKATSHYEEMKQKVKEVVPDAVQELLQHGRDTHVDHTTKMSSEDTKGATAHGRDADLGHAYNASAAPQGEQLLDQARNRQNEKLGAAASQAQSGPAGPAGSNRLAN